MLADLRSARHEPDRASNIEAPPAPASPPVARARESHDEASNAPSLEPSDASRHPSALRTRLVTALVAVVLLVSALAVTVFYTPSAVRRDAGATDTPTTNAPANALPAPAKLYARMSEREQLAFIDAQEQRISALMGERPARLDEDSLRAIKRHVDAYVARTGSTSDGLGKDDLRLVFTRAMPHVPLIARSFEARKVPVIVGIYLPIIESEYRECYVSSKGAKGMFQFLPNTARTYGVAPEEMCDAAKMTPAAARYIADRMAELGDDSQSMTLVMLSYNRGAEGVRNALRRLRAAGDFERNFWTLYARRDQLGDTFSDENTAYVPLFFAAAIIGENPQTFDLPTPPLSSLTRAGTPAASG